MVEINNSYFAYILATVGIIIVLLIWNAYLAWRTKRMIAKQIALESQYAQPNQNYPY